MEARPWQEVNEFYSNAVNGHSSLSALFGIQVGFYFFIYTIFIICICICFACDIYMLFFLNCICFCISYTRLMLLMLLPTFLVYVIFLNISITQLSLVSHNGVAEAARKQTQTQTRCFLNEILESTR